MATASSAQREPSMEEILASIRRIIEDSDTARPLDMAPDSDDVAGNMNAPEPVNAAGDIFGADFKVELDAEDLHGTAVANDPMPRLGAEVPVRSAEVRPIRADIPAPANAEPAAETEPALATAGPSIISDTTGRQVAASFGELSDAFAASRRRSFDEMAQEMLRPMLQDWLDNNLPTLVEKLVREEIERVARGG